jgi:hypothetical protein
MKKCITLLTLTALLSGSLYAEDLPVVEKTDETTQSSTPFTTVPEVTAEPTGQAAMVATKSGQNNWQNWVFVGGSLVAAGIAVLVISLDSGSHAH